MPNEAHTATAANAAQYRANTGEGVSMLDALDPAYLDDDCPLCSEPLNGEQFFHLSCGQRENAAAEQEAKQEADAARWEREGRAEMYATLFGE